MPAQIVQETLTTLSGDRVRLGIPASALAPRTLDRIEAVVGGLRYQLTFNNAERQYVTTFPVPTSGQHQILIIVRYADAADILRFTIDSLPYGTAMDSGRGDLLADARVILYDESHGGATWPASQYEQDNPQTTDRRGVYGYIVPNGQYRLVATKSGYHDRRTLLFTVDRNVINRPLRLIERKNFVFDSNASLGENAANLAAKLKEQGDLALGIISDLGQRVQEVADNPAVEETTRKVVAPTTIGVSIVVVTPSLWSTVIPLFRFVFLQPLLFIGARKRRGWGQVYNSLTKLPVDLAVVRLIDAASGRLVRSRVTDQHGRYLFIVEPGKYRIEAVKQTLIFPSHLLAAAETDGRMLDLYHGEEIAVTEEAATITPNIPLDPAEAEVKGMRRISWEKKLRALQHAVSLTGIVLTGVSIYITPQWYLWAFLFLHAVVYIMFLRYVKPKKPKGWGIVYDRGDKKPVGKAVARLYAKQYNKLVDSQVTDKKGRYAFLVGPNNYYLTFEHVAYQPYRTPDLDLMKESADKLLIKKDVALERGGGEEKKIESVTMTPGQRPDSGRDEKLEMGKGKREMGTFDGDHSVSLPKSDSDEVIQTVRRLWQD